MAFPKWLSSKSGIWITWVLATTVAWGLEQWGFTGFLGGALLGTFQWLVLRRVITKAAWWIVATALAMPIGSLATLVILMALGDPSPPIGVMANGAGFVGTVLTSGIIVGAAQCLVLQGKVPNAGWWIGATAGGTALYQTTLFLGREWWSDSPSMYLLVLAIAAVVAAVVTGGALVWLLQKKGQWSDVQSSVDG